MGKAQPPKWDFRDVSSGIQSLRNFLLGRKYVYHNRFPPLISPRTIPPPDIPRGPDHRYSNQYYGARDVLNSVKPPVVAPIAEGRKPTDGKPDKVKCDPKTMDTQSIVFTCPPTPGPTWWFDCHTYYKEVRPGPCPPLPPIGPPSPPPPPPCPPYPPPCPPPPCAEAAPPPCPEVKKDPCAEEPPCKLAPCQREKLKPPPPPPEICDPCDPKWTKKK